VQEVCRGRFFLENELIQRMYHDPFNTGIDRFGLVK
jgi:hypothetical protein